MQLRGQYIPFAAAGPSACCLRGVWLFGAVNESILSPKFRSGRHDGFTGRFSRSSMSLCLPAAFLFVLRSSIPIMLTGTPSRTLKNSLKSCGSSIYSECDHPQHFQGLEAVAGSPLRPENPVVRLVECVPCRHDAPVDPRKHDMHIHRRFLEGAPGGCNAGGTSN